MGERMPMVAFCLDGNCGKTSHTSVVAVNGGSRPCSVSRSSFDGRRPEGGPIQLVDNDVVENE